MVLVFTVGALNMQGFVWKFLCATYNFFIHSFVKHLHIYKNKQTCFYCFFPFCFSIFSLNGISKLDGMVDDTSLS